MGVGSVLFQIGQENLLKRTLICWVGATDFRAAAGKENGGVGPIGQAVKTFEFDQVFLLNNYPEEKIAMFLHSIKGLTKAKITSWQKSLLSTGCGYTADSSYPKPFG